MLRPFLAILILVLFGIILRFNQTMTDRYRTVTVWMESAPFSSDPIDYDLIAHHIVFRSVFSSVVSQYQNGSIEPTLLANWNADKEFTKWTLELKDDVTFETGEKITAAHVINSWLRVADIMKKRGSKSGFFEKVAGYGAWQGFGHQFNGLVSTGNKSITVQFEEPFRNFLETISFGLYSVVHPSCYDQQSGKWLNPKCAISSGPYTISSWTDIGVKLQLRDKRFERDRKSLRSIEIRWNPESRKSADLVVGFSVESFSKSYEFFGTPTANIAYVRCNSWQDVTGPCGSVERRRALRHAFYKKLSQMGELPDLSFFPLSIPGIKSFRLEEIQNYPVPSSIKFRISGLKQRPFEVFNGALAGMGSNGELIVSPVTMTSEEAKREIGQDSSKYSFDLVAQYTGILVEAPKDDIRFMFLSREGIRLPDSDGSIGLELDRRDFDPQTVNEKLWDQAIIWPLAHFSLGFWAKENQFDFTRINLSLPPTDFEYLQWR